MLKPRIVRKKNYPSPGRLLIITAAAIFVAETMVMFALMNVPAMPFWLEALLDAALLSLLSAPFLYFYLYRPMADHIQERRLAEERLSHQSLYDPLTGMVNRESLRQRLAEAIMHANEQRRCLAFILVDINRLSEINDTLGHNTGDRLLQQVAHRLSKITDADSVVARLGGDEFGLLIPGLDEGSVADTAEFITRHLCKPYTIDNLPVTIEVCMGLTVYPQHGDNADVLLQRGDVAKRHAKQYYNNYSIYDPKQDPYNVRRLAMFAELQHAIDHHELCLHFQPKVDIASRRTRDVEALVRWQHPRHGLLPPGEFIPIAEQTELIKTLTYWVLREALIQCRHWREAGVNLRVSVNISAKNLLDNSLPATLQRILDETDNAASSLLLEITESALMIDPQRSLDILSNIKTMGVGISIDDFGTGFSSLEYLSRLPAEEIKIDRSFIHGMLESEHDAVIVRSTIELAHSLNLSVTAEGVETKLMWDRLCHLKCNRVQGYFLSRPVSTDKLLSWIQHTQQHDTLENLMLHQ